MAQTGNVHSLTLEQRVDLGLSDFKPVHVLATQSSHPLVTDALAMVDPEGHRLTLIVNFTDRALKVSLNGKEQTVPANQVLRVGPA